MCVCVYTCVCLCMYVHMHAHACVCSTGSELRFQSTHSILLVLEEVRLSLLNALTHKETCTTR